MIDVNTLFGFWPIRKADISLDTLLRLLEEKGIHSAFCLSAQGIFYDFVEGNRETLDACKQHSRLIPVGTVNPCRWIGCLEEAQRLIDNGIRLLRFFPQFQEWHIGQAAFRKLLDEVLAPSGVGLMIPAGEGITAIGELAKQVSNPIIVEGLRYDRLADAIAMMSACPNTYLETHIVNSPNFVELLKAEIGVERMVYGSYAPLAGIDAATAPIECAGVSREDKALIFGDNISRILGVSL